MHKCFKCGTEFEGTVCPKCGEWYKEGKECPNCGVALATNATYCKSCGYHFAEERKTEETEEPKQNRAKALFAGAWDYAKSHIALTVMAAIFLAGIITVLALIPTFIKMSVNGTYFCTYSDREYITLHTGKWQFSNGLSGTYSVSGKTITFKYNYETEEEAEEDASVIVQGILEEGVLRIQYKTNESEEWQGGKTYENEDYLTPKKWFTKYGLYIILGVLIVIIFIWFFCAGKINRRKMMLAQAMQEAEEAEEIVEKERKRNRTNKK